MKRIITLVIKHDFETGVFQVTSTPPVQDDDLIRMFQVYAQQLKAKKYAGGDNQSLSLQRGINNIQNSIN